MTEPPPGVGIDFGENNADTDKNVDVNSDIEFDDKEYYFNKAKKEHESKEIDKNLADKSSENSVEINNEISAAAEIKVALNSMLAFVGILLIFRWNLSRMQIISFLILSCCDIKENGQKSRKNVNLKFQKIRISVEIAKFIKSEIKYVRNSLR